MDSGRNPTGYAQSDVRLCLQFHQPHQVGEHAADLSTLAPRESRGGMERSVTMSKDGIV